MSSSLSVVLFLFTFYILLYFTFLLFLVANSSDSMNLNTLCNSANGTFVTLDDCLPDTGYGSPNNLDWDVNFVSRTGSEGTSSSEQREHNVESLALNAMGQDQSGGNMCLFLEDWELARVALSCHTALGMLCQEMHEGLVAGLLLPRGQLSQQGMPFSHRGRAVTTKERDVVRGRSNKERDRRVLFELGGLLVSFQC